VTAPRPLTGLRVAITRPRDQAEEMAAALEAHGAVPHICPLVRLEAAGDAEALRRAALAAADYDWIVFTSANAVRFFAPVLESAGTRQAVRRVAAVGPATAAAARELGLPVALVPARATGDALAAELAAAVAGEHSGGSAGPEGAGSEARRPRVLFPRAREVRQALPETLRRCGVRLDELECYRTVSDPDGASVLRDRLRAGECDVIAFTSPSQVAAFTELVGAELAAGVDIAVIGPITAKAVREAGLSVRIEADPHTLSGFVAAFRSGFDPDADSRTS
jgi:uroporphyrinogen-III synthase